MSTYSYTRADLVQYGLQHPEHTHVCVWEADDGQSDMVVGLGTSHSDARWDAENEARRGSYLLTGGSLSTYLISDC
jgi:hypothetical protein